MSVDDFKTRLMREKLELYDRLSKLDKFLGTAQYSALPEIDCVDLAEQLTHMRRYHDVLDRRCVRLCPELMKEDEAPPAPAPVSE
jgi:hypothetical protein